MKTFWEKHDIVVGYVVYAVVLVVSLGVVILILHREEKAFNTLGASPQSKVVVTELTPKFSLVCRDGLLYLSEVGRIKERRVMEYETHGQAACEEE